MDWAVSRRFPRNAQLWPKKTSEQNRPDILLVECAENILGQQHAMWLAISEERKGVMLIAQTYTPNLKGNIYIYINYVPCTSNTPEKMMRNMSS